MNITYTNDIHDIKASDLQGFFDGWPNPPSPETHYKMLENSAYIWLAIDSDTKAVVGFINAISDKTLSAYIPLLEVLPAYKGQGIGKQMVQRMIQSLNHLYMVDIVCDDDLIDFYKTHGFMKGSSMMLRNYDRQAGVL